MKHKIFLLVAAYLLVAHLSSALATHYEIFVLAGQSNMDGRADVAKLTGDLASYKTPQPNILIHFTAGGLRRPLTVSDGFQPLQPGFSGTPGTRPGGIPSNNFGPEVSFGPAIAAAMPSKHILLVKCSEGGTSLKNDWSPNERGKLYDRLISWIQETEKMIRERGDTFEIRGILWHQGESDSGQPEYAALLAEFITRLRSDLGVNNLPFLIGQAYDDGSRGRATLTAAQKATAQTVAHTAFVESDGLATFDNGTHFDATSQIELGKRFAREMIKLLSLNNKP